MEQLSVKLGLKLSFKKFNAHLGSETARKFKSSKEVMLDASMAVVVAVVAVMVVVAVVVVIFFLSFFKQKGPFPPSFSLFLSFQHKCSI